MSYGYKQVNNLLDFILVDLLFINSFCLVNIYFDMNNYFLSSDYIWEKKARKAKVTCSRSLCQQVGE